MPEVELSDMQKKALDKDVQVLTAGAGSGKTLVLTHRYDEVILRKITVPHIVAFTFTNKAANEMRAKVVKYVLEKMETAKKNKDPKTYKMWWTRERELREARISTIHAFCNGLLKEYAIQVGLNPAFGVLDENTSQAIVMREFSERYWFDIMTLDGDLKDKNGNVVLTRVQLVELLQWSKTLKDRLVEFTNNRGSLPEGIWDLYSGTTQDIKDRIEKKSSVPSVTAFFKEPLNAEKWEFYLGVMASYVKLLRHYIDSYETELDKRGVIDFTSMQSKTLKLLSENNTVLERVRKGISAVMVDEFQDTDPQQGKIMELISNDKELFVVGDVKQSIYSFRKADPDLLIELMGKRKSESLSENFRSLDAVIETVNKAFKDKELGIPYEEMKPERKDNKKDKEGQPRGRTGIIGLEKGAFNEFDVLARHILALHENTALEFQERDDKGNVDLKAPKRGPRWRDIAVLKRKMTDVHKLIESFMRHGIPSVIIGGRGFFQQDEIADMYNVIRVLDNPSDDVALLGALRSCVFGLTDSDIFRVSGSKGYKLHDKVGEFARADPNAPVSKAAAKLNEWRVKSIRMAVPDVIDMVYDEGGMFGISSYSSRAEQIAQNLLKFKEMALTYSRDNGGGLGGFLKYIDTMMNEVEKEAEEDVNIEGQDAVRVMSIHQAKGLQFPVVYVPNLSDAARESITYTLDETHGLNMKLSGGVSHLVDKDGKIWADYYENLKDMEKEKGLQERRRLLYVACTRAEDALYLLCEVPTSASSESTMFHSLAGMDNLTANKKPEDKMNFLFGNYGFTEATYLTEDAANDLKLGSVLVSPEILRKEARASPSVATTAPSMDIEPVPFEPTVTSLNPTQYSDYVKSEKTYYINHVLEIPEEGFGEKDESKIIRPIEKGNAYHRMFESAEDIESGKTSIEDVLAQYVSKDHTLFTEEARRMKHAFDEFKKLGINWKNGVKELPFQMWIGGGYFSGKMDMLIPGEVCEIVDYKTNRITPERTEDMLALDYEPQIKLYAIAAMRITGCKMVNAGLFFTETGQMRTREWDEKDIVGFEAEVQETVKKLLREGGKRE